MADGDEHHLSMLFGLLCVHEERKYTKEVVLVVHRTEPTSQMVRAYKMNVFSQNATS